MTTEDKIPERATMDKVVMKKSLLLEKLVENKAKHDGLLEAAIYGYWMAAEIKTKTREKEFYENLADYGAQAKREFKKFKEKIKAKKYLPNCLSITSISINTSLGLTYPEDHSADYDRAIEMMKSTVYDEVSLSTIEFNNYVMNDWSWRHGFNSTVNNYFANVSGVAIGTGMYVPSYTGCSSRFYDNSRAAIYSALASGTSVNL